MTNSINSLFKSFSFASGASAKQQQGRTEEQLRQKLQEYHKLAKVAALACRLVRTPATGWLQHHSDH